MFSHDSDIFVFNRSELWEYLVWQSYAQVRVMNASRLWYWIWSYQSICGWFSDQPSTENQKIYSVFLYTISTACSHFMCKYLNFCTKAWHSCKKFMICSCYYKNFNIHIPSYFLRLVSLFLQKLFLEEWQYWFFWFYA